MNQQQESHIQMPSYADLIDLASEKMGGKTLRASDDFFAPKENLLKEPAAIFIPDKFTDNGKWMDGWESRRKRGINGDSHDWCVLKLGSPGVIKGVNVDTSHFTGNFPESCSLEACQSSEDLPPEKAPWTEILPRQNLKGGQFNFFEIANTKTWTHLRLNIFPDGGIARLRVYGEVKLDWGKIIPALKSAGKDIDLALATNGGKVLACNDHYFGPKDNLIMPGQAKTMGEGWETRRKRGIDSESHDWIVVRLGHRGKVRAVEIDTNHFKGNYPESCLLEGGVMAPDHPYQEKTVQWREILPRIKLQPHHQHFFENQLKEREVPFDLIRLKIFPDGGISRLRVNGEPVP